jgi:Ca-activated chloride channel family protein
MRRSRILSAIPSDRANFLPASPMPFHLPIQSCCKHGTMVFRTALVWVMLAQSLLSAQEPEFTLNVNVDLVELSVTVLDENDRFVPGLEARNFEVFEDQVQQDVSLFLHEDRPVSLGLVIDNSRSMERKRPRVEAAAQSFLHLSNPDDEAFLIYFDDAARLAHGFTADFGVLNETLSAISPYGQTALFDAIMLALDTLSEARYAGKAILVVSDGADNASAAAYEDVLERVRRAGAAIYTIGVLNDTSSSQEARSWLESLAAATGGRAFFPKTADEVPNLTARIARELRELYTLGYVPTYRHGYYAPGSQSESDD